MGGRAGGSSSGFGSRSLSDAAINRMAKSVVEGTTLDPRTVPELMKGEILVDSGFNRDTKQGWATNARVPEIEAQISNEIGDIPQINGSSAKAKAKYVKDSIAYSDRYQSAMTKGITAYKKVLSKTKNKELKSLIANKIKTYTEWKSEQKNTLAWVMKNYVSK